jgi:hypothetical protein
MTLATRIRENKALYVAAGAGDFAVEKFRELPDTVAKLRESASKTATKYQGDLKENVTKIQERVDTKDIPGAAVSYVTHAGTRVVEFVDALAQRGEKVVNRAEAATEEIEAGSKETAQRARTAASGPKKSTPSTAKKTDATPKS